MRLFSFLLSAKKSCPLMEASKHKTLKTFLKKENSYEKA